MFNNKIIIFFKKKKFVSFLLVMEPTIRAIISASKLPLSIVIVGVGNSDFTNMKILDADDKPLVVSNNLSNIINVKIILFLKIKLFEYLNY
jgi:hypothetical protein